MDVAVIGMSCRFPEANNAQEYWNNLIAGKDSVRSVPKDRWYMEGELVAGFLSCHLDEFDSNFFNINPKEASFIDPQQRLFLEVSWESLEDSGIPPTSLFGTNTGVYLGIGNDEYFRTQLNPKEDSMYKIIGNTFSAASGRLSHFLNLHGPSLPFEATCASSAAAIHYACNGLRNGDCDLAIAGGVSTLIETSTSYPSALISPSCRSFDSSASGFAPSEGCGVIILKLLKDAIKDGNNILGIIRGSSISHTGRSTSYGTPATFSEERAIRNALAAASIIPSQVSYVEAHAGGTAIGDPTEFKALTNVFGHDSNRDKPLVIGSYKTNIGHPLAAAGVAAVIKVLLCMKHELIPKILHLNEFHPDIVPERIPATFPRTNTSWERPTGNSLIAGINCFGITGTNVHILMEEPPLVESVKYAKTESVPPPLSLLTISAKDDIAVDNLRNKYKEALWKLEPNQFEDFVYSANVGRSHLSNRIAVIGKSSEEMIQKLGAMDYSRGTIGSTHENIVFMFTGHGCQYFGMAKELYSYNTVFQNEFDHCNVVYKNNLGISLRDFIWEQASEITLTKYSQPAIYCIEYCIYKLWRSLGVAPDFVIGHSIGEFAASVAAGFISFEDGMKLVCCRSILLDQLPDSRMLAIGESIETTKDILKSFHQIYPNNWVDIACVNSKEQVVVSTEVDTASLLKEFIKEQFPSVKSKVLTSQHGFHSRNMDPILNTFEEIANEIVVQNPKCKYVSSVLHREMSVEDFNGTYWRNHCRQMVSFSKAMDVLLQENSCRIFIEIGPQPTLLNFAIANNRTKHELITCPSIRSNQDNWTTFLNSLARIYVNTDVDIKFENIYKGNKVKVPLYCFNRKKCWPSNPQSNQQNSIAGKGPITHPLLGWKMNIAGSEDIYFINYLSETSTGYVHDHVVSDHVIVPAACYMEMMLAIAKKLFNLDYPVIQEVQVLRALPLEARSRQVQVKIEERDNGTVLVSIYSENITEDDGEWKQYAQGLINLKESSTVTGPHQSFTEDQISTFKASLCTDEFGCNIDDLYKQLELSSLTFGPLFRSFEAAWWDATNSAALTQFKSVPTEEGEFICHPITLDAIVQTFWKLQMLERKDNPFALPIGINKLIWYGDENSTLPEILTLYIENKSKATLFDETTGRIYATVDTVTVQESTTSAFLKSISAVEQLPQFMTKDYVPVPGFITNEDRMNMAHIKSFPEEGKTKALKLLNNFVNDFNCDEEKCRKLPYLYILRSFHELGWNPRVNVPFTLQSMINPNAKLVADQAYNSFITILEEEGLVSPLDKSNRDGEWKLLSPLPTRDSIDKMIEEVCENLEDKFKNTIDYKYLRHLGDSLTPVLQGSIDPASIFFSNRDTNLNHIYTESIRCVFDLELIKTTFSQAFSQQSYNSNEKLRILEIGGGTGSATTAVIKILEELGITFEYTFTDISPTLVKEEMKHRYEISEKNRLNFKILDIEQDPKCQGFTPYAYDCIIAHQVLHATEDLEITLDNVRHLLVPNGYFFLTEIFGHYRDFAISFDLMKSYWRVKDFRNYVTVEPEIWVNLLQKASFTDIVNLSIPNCQRGQFVSRATPTLHPFRSFEVGRAPTLAMSNRPCWLIFCESKDDPTVQRIAENFKLVGRNPFFVIDGPRFDKLHNTFYINPKRTSDFQQLAHIIKNVKIEGIIYMWSLIADQKKLKTTEELKHTQEIIAGGFLNLLKLEILNAWSSRLILVTSCAEDENPAQGTLWGMFDTYVNEYPEASTLAIDITDTTDPQAISNCLFNLTWDKMNERGVQFKNGKLITARLHNYDSSLKTDDITIPFTGKYQLEDASTFQFVSKEECESETISHDEIEVDVRSVGLNFRDILLSNALLETDYPNSVGLEFSGIVSQIGSDVNSFAIGDRVAGLTCSGAFSSHLIVKKESNLLFRIPPWISYSGAATIPVAFGTCYFAMIEIARLSRNERVLIHTGSGGVGLAGIQLAHLIGAQVFVTAGTNKKRNYLRECLGLTNVYDSRSHDYKDEILRDTNGEGVQVVINTLTGPGFKEATLACTAKNGRFVELSKLNVWKSEDVANLRKDVEYTIFDAFDMIIKCDPSLATSLHSLASLLEDKKIDVLPHTLYPLAQMKSAFKYFHGHLHIGKVIVEIPETNEKFSNITLFNPYSTYLVTGGIGGLGFELGKYIWENGGNVLLVGRRTPSEEMAAKISSYGDRMKYIQCDIGNYEKCDELLKSLTIPVRGIFHLAGVFSNNFVAGQTIESYGKAFNPKVYGSWNLHLLTKGMPLDHFVMYSSIAAVIGSTGLSNYSAANRYLDSLNNYRVDHCGLPGLSIDWGPWSEVGTAAESFTGMFQNFYHFSPQIGLKSMERAMRLKLQDIVIADMDLDFVTTASRVAPYVSELEISNAKHPKKTLKMESLMTRQTDLAINNLAKEILAADDPKLRLEKMELLVEGLCRIHGGMSQVEKLDRNSPLALMGMDSLIGMEMRLRVSKLFDVTVPTNAILENNSISLFANYITTILPTSTSSASSSSSSTEPSLVLNIHNESENRENLLENSKSSSSELLKSEDIKPIEMNSSLKEKLIIETNELYNIKEKSKINEGPENRQRKTIFSNFTKRFPKFNSFRKKNRKSIQSIS